LKVKSEIFQCPWLETLVMIAIPRWMLGMKKKLLFSFHIPKKLVKNNIG